MRKSWKCKKSTLHAAVWIGQIEVAQRSKALCFSLKKKHLDDLILKMLFGVL